MARPYFQRALCIRTHITKILTFQEHVICGDCNYLKKICILSLNRTGGSGSDTPHETPPMCQTTASLDLPRMDINASVATAEGALVDPHNLGRLQDSSPESQDFESEAASGEEGLF